jgi:muramoyltetrapeptide carboxypeptidase LdcA involved in peptidoglycan recycling
VPDVLLYGLLIGDHVIHAKPKEHQDTHLKEAFLDLAGEPGFSYMRNFPFGHLKSITMHHV